MNSHRLGQLVGSIPTEKVIVSGEGPGLKPGRAFLTLHAGIFSGFSNLFLSHTNEGRKVFRAGLKSSQEKADGYEVANIVGTLPTSWELYLKIL